LRRIDAAGRSARVFFAEALAAQSSGGTQHGVSRRFVSLLDAVFRMPLADVLARVNLADEVVGALVNRAATTPSVSR